MLKSDKVLRTQSVLKTSISRTKDGKKSESEVAMCDRMQMYNTKIVRSLT
jgi:hypothetical protein